MRAQGFSRLKGLVSEICLRRTKTQRTRAGEPLLQLPPKSLKVVRVALPPTDWDRYRRLARLGMQRYRQIRLALDAQADGDTSVDVNPVRGALLLFLMRLRQACCHPSLLPDDVDAQIEALFALPEAADGSGISAAVLPKLSADNVQKVLAVLTAGVMEECVICLDTLTHPRVTECGHLFCRACIMDHIKAQRHSDLNTTCPM